MLNVKILKECRKKMGITQAMAAHSIDITLQTYSCYELGKRQPSLEMLVKLADLFKVSIDYLLGRDGHFKERSNVDIQYTNFKLDSSRLKEARENSHFRQAIIAENIGVDLRTYQYYESGLRQPSIKILIKLADFLCIAIDYLFGNSDQPMYIQHVARAFQAELKDAPAYVRNFYSDGLMHNENPATYRFIIEIAKSMWKENGDTEQPDTSFRIRLT